MISIADKTEILIQALPYIQQYEQKTFVIKYGGAAMVDEDLKETFAQDVTLLKKIGVRMVIVHGGGKDITDLASKIGLQSRFVKGQRYTDADMMSVVQMVLGGKTNQLATTWPDAFEDPALHEALVTFRVAHGEATARLAKLRDVLVAAGMEQSP